MSKEAMKPMTWSEAIEAISTLAEKPEQPEPEIVQRVKRFAGKTLRTARNPNITARECIELAGWIVANTSPPAQRKPLPRIMDICDTGQTSLQLVFKTRSDADEYKNNIKEQP